MKLLNYVDYLFYFIMLIGLYYTFSSSFAEAIENRRARSINEKRNRRDDTSEKRLKISEYVEYMLGIVKGKSSREDVISFYELSILLSMSSFILCYFALTVRVAPFAGVTALFMPTLYYRTKLQEIRNETSREGEVLTSELLSNYKIYHGSMRAAVENTIETLSHDAPCSRRLLIRLQYDINAVASREELKVAIDRFKFGIDTNWSVLLATNIELSLVEGLDVSSSMEDLIQQIMKARKAMEETKRQGSEAKRMLRFMVPAIYLLTVISGIYFFGMTLGEFLRNQFRTDMGSAWFLAVCVSYMASLMFAEFVGREKMDI